MDQVVKTWVVCSRSVARSPAWTLHNDFRNPSHRFVLCSFVIAQCRFIWATLSNEIVLTNRCVPSGENEMCQRVWNGILCNVFGFVVTEIHSLYLLTIRISSGVSTKHIQILTNNHIFHSCDAMAWSTCCHNVVAASHKNRKATHWMRTWNEREREKKNKGHRWNDARDIIKIPRDFFLLRAFNARESSWVWTTDISGGNQWSQPIHIHIYCFAAIEIVT